MATNKAKGLKKKPVATRARRRQPVATGGNAGNTKVSAPVSKALPENTSAARDALGRWLPGASPNAGGRPKSINVLTDLGREHTPEAFAKVLHIMRTTQDEKIALDAAEFIVNRGYGRAAQAITGANGEPLPLVNIILNEGRAISDQGEAMRAYAELCANPELNSDGLRIESPEAAQLEHEAQAAPLSPVEAKPTAQPLPALLDQIPGDQPDQAVTTWERLGE